MKHRREKTSAGAGLAADDGYVLVSTLWIIGLVATAAAAMSLFSVGSLGFVATSSDQLEVEALAQAGVEAAFLRMQEADLKAPLCGRTTWRSGEARVDVAWIGETGRIDLNAGDPKLLQSMFAALAADDGVAAEATGVLLERRPSDTTPAQGATVKTGFRSVAELDATRLPPELSASVKAYVTVFNGRAQIDPRLASERILGWLPDMTEARLRRLIELKDANSGDIRAWRQEAGAAGDLLSLDPPKAVRLRVNVALPGGMRRAFEIVAKRFDEDVEPYRILSWRSGARQGAADPCPGDIR